MSSMICFLAMANITRKYTIPPITIIKKSVKVSFIIKELKGYMTRLIKTVAIKGGRVGLIILKSIYLLTRITTKTADIEINAETTATALNPNIDTPKTVSVHVEIVQKTMRPSVSLILPVAFKTFVRGVEIEENPAFTAKKPSDKSAGSHLEYLGIMVRK